MKKFRLCFEWDPETSDAVDVRSSCSIELLNCVVPIKKTFVFHLHYFPAINREEERKRSSAMASFISWLSTTAFAILFFVLIHGETSTATIAEPKAPNFQYFERPRYRYPYYDENGKGKLLYGYGGPELYQYKTYSPLEGIH